MTPLARIDQAGGAGLTGAGGTGTTGWGLEESVRGFAGGNVTGACGGYKGFCRGNVSGACGTMGSLQRPADIASC